MGYNVWPETDCEPDIAHREQRECAEKRQKFGATVDRTPNPEREPERDDRNGAQQRDIGPRKPTHPDFGLKEWGPQAHDADADKEATHQPPSLRARPILQDPFRFHDQPGRAE